ncbi:hypothetical protein [Sharpea azabuensis]|uniref:hypothetical protein n=1 Tax=Sharpea azabuensis TaxID=322505 RepID=UPI00156A4ED0|nr:hypothetical protein [Sharpea azabuensis]
MNKEELLLKNFSVLKKNIKKNYEPITAIIKQLLEINPSIGLRCWENCIKDNIEAIEKDFYKEDFSSDGIGWMLIRDMEYELVGEDSFAEVALEFAKNSFLLEVIYTKCPISEYFQGSYVISYLIRNKHYKEAENVLSAIYKNKTFNNFSKLWENIVEKFSYGKQYNPCVIDSSLISSQSKKVKQLCLAWVERIMDEEEQAAAMVYVMQMF